MEQGTSLYSLMIVVILSFLIPIALDRLRWHFVPVVVVEIVAGIVLGKSGFGFIHTDQWLQLLSTLGFIYLMFLSGLEIDFDAFRVKRKESEVNPILVSSLTFASILVISAAFGFALQWSGMVKDAIFMTLIISTVSLSIVVPTLKDKRITNTPYGQTILLTTVIADFATILLLALYVAVRSHNLLKPFLIFILFIVVFFFYRLIRHFEMGKVIQRISRESIQLGTRGVFALILFFVVLSEQFGAESILGAFLAGVILSLLSPKKEFVHQLTSFGFGFLIPIFFFMVGAKLELQSLMKNPQALLLLPLVLVSFYVSKLIPALFWKKWFNWKETIGAGFLLPSTLSLVVAGTAIGVELHIITTTLQAALILSAVISCIISPILFQRIVPDKVDQVQKRISLIGASLTNLSLARELSRHEYQVALYSTDPAVDEAERNYPFKTVIVEDYSPERLMGHKVEESDSVVVFTAEDSLNVEIANRLKENGAGSVICRVESEDQSQAMAEGIHRFSTFSSNRILLQALIEHPAMVKFLEVDHSIYEIRVANTRLHNAMIRNLSFLRDALVIRIFRENNIIIPHGDTPVKLDDILLVSGDPESVELIRRELS